jgi:hypothetical protein
MIGMNNLGSMGRLGNQMFQYASLVGIAKNIGYEHCIPDHSKATWFDKCENGNIVTVYHQLQHLFKLEYLDGRFGQIDGYEIEVHQHEFCEDLFNECPDNASLHGHLESYKYFENADSEVKKDYTFKDSILESALNYHKKNKINNSVCINVRRGDFIKFQDHHAVCTENYYFQCIESLGKDRQYLIISDDIEWCKTVFLGSNCIFLDIQEDKIYKPHFDMCVGSLCDDFIIANSTFSWWMSYLGKNKDKVVFMPDPWFGPSLQHLDASGYYFPKTIKVKREVVRV